MTQNNGRRVWHDEDDAPPPPSAIRELAEAGKYVDAIFGHVRGLLRNPAEREGLVFLRDLLRGQNPDPGTGRPTIPTTEGGPVDQPAVKDTTMRIDLNKLMDEIKNGLVTLSLVQGDRTIRELPALFEQHRSSIVEQVQKTLAGCIVYEVPDEQADGGDAGEGDRDPRTAGDRQV